MAVLQNAAADTFYVGACCWCHAVAALLVLLRKTASVHFAVCVHCAMYPK